ncbi:NAD(P)/FAD-dependent oxidoreductase [Candidatus Leptofilum sp.]|uniref:NAD(P)/FAD-dependent oxidoreductase n=1 Tax=Candidatus Leptofilum sp. TaxID=3241576 RepID=UPI003B5C2082
MKNKLLDVLVVGAGLAGLMAANVQQNAGKSVVVVEKAQGVGGRLATWRLGPGRGDYGAQFFTVREPQFRQFVDEWQQAGLVFEWSRGWADGSAVATNQGDGYPRYAITGGMTAVAKHLAANLTVHNQTRLTQIQVVGDGWEVTVADGRSYKAHALLLTPPVPQSLALLDAGNVPLAAADRAVLEKISYAPCLSGMFWVEGDVSLPEPGGLQRPEATLSWLADNQRKGISPEAQILTAHANPTVSQLWYEAPKGELVGIFMRALRPFLSKNSTIQEYHIHKWRYALPTTLHPERTLLAAGLPPLAFAGDAFNGPRVEGAALSGLAVAHDLLNA